MPRAGLGAMLLVVAALTGCEHLFTRPAGSSTPAVVRSLAPAIAPDGLIVESALLERPLGDSYLDQDLWNDTQPAGTPETRALLTENGMRAGILGGILPTRFQEILENESEVVDPHGMTFSIRKEAVIPTAGPVDPCEFHVLENLAGKPAPVSLQNARCGILVRPQPAGEGRVKVWCEPLIQHGSSREWLRPTEDGTKFAKHQEVPVEKYSGLGFEVQLRANECLVIGWSAEETDTLGSVLFGVDANGHPHQRVLVIRARQLNTATASELPPIPGPGRVALPARGRN